MRRALEDLILYRVTIFCEASENLDFFSSEVHWVDHCLIYMFFDKWVCLVSKLCPLISLVSFLF